MHARLSACFLPLDVLAESLVNLSSLIAVLVLSGFFVLDYTPKVGLTPL